MQPFWEAFRVAGGGRTTYMFSYADADRRRPSFQVRAAHRAYYVCHALHQCLFLAGKSLQMFHALFAYVGQVSDQYLSSRAITFQECTSSLPYPSVSDGLQMQGDLGTEGDFPRVVEASSQGRYRPAILVVQNLVATILFPCCVAGAGTAREVLPAAARLPGGAPL